MVTDSQPSLRDFMPSTGLPGVETPGYFRLSLRDDCPSHGNLCKKCDAPGLKFPRILDFGF